MSSASVLVLFLVNGNRIVPLPPLEFVRDVRHRDPVLLLLPALPGHAQLGHLPAHVQLHHVTHHCCPPRLRQYHLQPERR